MEAHHQDDHIMMMIKGKRTKRQRPSSPLALTMLSASSTTTTTTTTTTKAASEDCGPDDPSELFFHKTTSSTSTNSIEFTKIVQENDDEDMANCLILLGQSQPYKWSHNSPQPPSKVAVTSGLHVYECKTCNRAFPSFQALGGHRASHKKPPKATLEEKRKQNENISQSYDHGVSKDISSTTLSLRISSNDDSVKVVKDHECLICGARFASGQALGGHMRRHRSAPMAPKRPDAEEPRTLLSLDLNLPAPPEDEHRETKFPMGSKNQIIVFSSNSSLVHCHF